MSKARDLADLGGVTARLDEVGNSDGALSNRNILINGNLTVNQRGLSIASVATGAYGEDRWKKTAGGMTQIIEEVNYLPSTVYTLSGTGVTTQQITSPASGDWTLPDIAVTARLIQLELGDQSTPFEHRSDELQRCQRYYCHNRSPSTPPSMTAYYYYENSAMAVDFEDASPCSLQFPVTMRATPSMQYGRLYSYNSSFWKNITSGSVTQGGGGVVFHDGGYQLGRPAVFGWIADAEL